MSSTEELRQFFAAQPNVRLAVLFGSHARGVAVHRGSDLDLGILLQDSSHEAKQAIEHALYGAIRANLDIVYLDTAPPLLRFEIARDGVVLRERTPGEWTDFKVRAMRDWWDWAPSARRLYRAAIRDLKEGLQLGPA